MSQELPCMSQRESIIACIRLKFEGKKGIASGWINGAMCINRAREESSVVLTLLVLSYHVL